MLLQSWKEGPWKEHEIRDWSLSRTSFPGEKEAGSVCEGAKVGKKEWLKRRSLMTHKSFKVEGKKVLYIKERVLHCSNVRGTLKLRKYKKLPKLHPHPHPTEISATTTLLPCKVIIEKKKEKWANMEGGWQYWMLLRSQVS